MGVLLAWRNESFENHVMGMLELWNIKFSRAYTPTLSRVLDLNPREVNLLVKKAVILHDAGKLYRGYQEALRDGRSGIRAEYRHELVSAYYAHGWILGHRMSEVDYCLTSAIALHHEPILMGQVGRIREPYLTITEVLRRFNKVSQEGVLDMIDEGVSFLEGLLKTHVGLEVRLPRRVPVNRGESEEKSLARILRDILLMASVKGSGQHKAKLRLKTASLLSVLCVLDSWVANRARGMDDDGGTFITRYAGLAEVPLAW